MNHELVEYRGKDPVGKIVDEGSLDDMYARRDELDRNPASLAARRHGVRPKPPRRANA